MRCFWQTNITGIIIISCFKFNNYLLSYLYETPTESTNYVNYMNAPLQPNSAHKPNIVWLRYLLGTL